MAKTKLYIAGPMRGYARFNFPAFHHVAGRLRAMGYVPFNPAEMDEKAGFDVASLPDDWDWKNVPNDFSFDDAFDRDVAAIKAADGIVMLPGWENSHGASTEKQIAEWLKKQVLYWDGEGLRNSPLPRDEEPKDEEDILDEAKRITSGDRNAQYGPPTQDFDRTARMWSGYLETEVKPADVAWMMIMLKASRNKHMHKRDNFVDAAGYARCGAICDGVN